MKKKLITICITLFIFFSSTVGIFATETTADNMVPYWIHDIKNQALLSSNAADVTFGLGIGNDVSSYVVRINGNSSFWLTYHVPSGETVYFRWAQLRYNISSNGSTVVKTSVNGSEVASNTYTRDGTSLGDFGTYGTAIIVEDYTNTSNTTQTVNFKITCNGSNSYYELIPILCGTKYMLDSDDSFLDSSSLSKFDLSDVELKLDNIYDLLSNAYHQLPIELWKTYNFFTRNYGYKPTFNLFGMSDSSSNYSIPWLSTSSIVSDTAFVKSKQFQIMSALDKLQIIILFNHNLDSTGHLKLYFEDGTSMQATRTVAGLFRTPGFDAMVYTFDLSDRSSGFVSLSIPNNNAWKNIIPLYMGDGSNISELVSMYSGIPSDTQSKLSTIINKFNSLISLFSNNNNSTVNNSTNANNQLSNSITEFDNIEKNQVDNMTQNLNNLPTIDFNAYNDFAPTVQFVSNTMQQIYDSNQYLRLLINACLLIGIALLLIGRGNRK